MFLSREYDDFLTSRTAIVKRNLPGHLVTESVGGMRGHRNFKTHFLASYDQGSG